MALVHQQCALPTARVLHRHKLVEHPGTEPGRPCWGKRVTAASASLTVYCSKTKNPRSTLAAGGSGQSFFKPGYIFFFVSFWRATVADGLVHSGRLARW